MLCDDVNEFSSATLDKYSRAAILKSVDNVLVDEYPGHGLISSPEALADSLNIRRNALMLPGVMRSCTSHAAHDLVEDEERAVLLAHGLHRGEVARRRRHAARRRPCAPR